MNSTIDTPPARREAARCQPAVPRALDSAALLGNRNEIEISHQGETYRLRRTRQGKLILTK